jgi:hypothetical protein
VDRPRKAVFSTLGTIITTCPCLVGGTTWGTETLSCWVSIHGCISTNTDCIGWPATVAVVVVIVWELFCTVLIGEGSTAERETDVDRGGGGGGTFLLITVVVPEVNDDTVAV